jgi:hypothetical protein
VDEQGSSKLLIHGFGQTRDAQAKLSCEVDSGRPAGISTGGFPRVASRTRRASRPGTGLSASPVGVAVVIHPLAGHGAGMAAPR